MAVMELWRRRDLEGTVKPEYIDGNFFTQDSVGNLVGVKCYKDGSEVALTGSVTGYCVLPSGETVSVAGTRSGNQASILVPQSALAYTGPLGITLKLIDGNTITTLMRIIVVVYRSKTDTVITPSSQIITDWANQISAALQEVEDASAAQDVKIADLKSAFGNAANIEFASGWHVGYAYNTPSSVKQIMPGEYVATNNFACVAMPCERGDVFYITGVGGSGAKLWVWITSAGNIIDRSASNLNVENLKVTAPASAAYLLVNVDTHYGYQCVKGKSVNDRLDDMPKDIASKSGKFIWIKDHVKSKIDDINKGSATKVVVCNHEKTLSRRSGCITNYGIFVTNNSGYMQATGITDNTFASIGWDESFSVLNSQKKTVIKGHGETIYLGLVVLPDTTISNYMVKLQVVKNGVDSTASAIVASEIEANKLTAYKGQFVAEDGAEYQVRLIMESVPVNTDIGRIAIWAGMSDADDLYTIYTTPENCALPYNDNLVCANGNITISYFQNAVADHTYDKHCIIRTVGSEKRAASNLIIDQETSDAILIDLSDSTANDAVINAVRQCNVRAVILTHFHADHFGMDAAVADNGFIQRLKQYVADDCVFYIQKQPLNIGSGLWSSGKAVLDNASVVQTIVPFDGYAVSVGDFALKFANVDTDYVTADYEETDSGTYNDTSLCCRITYGDATVYAFGDIYSKAQEHIYNTGFLTKANVIIAPHHGLSGKLYHPFIKKLDPDEIIINFGVSKDQSVNAYVYQRSYSSVITEWATENLIPVYDTFENGTFDLKVNKTGLTKSERLIPVEFFANIESFSNMRSAIHEEFGNEPGTETAATITLKTLLLSMPLNSEIYFYAGKNYHVFAELFGETAPDGGAWGNDDYSVIHIVKTVGGSTNYLSGRSYYYPFDSHSCRFRIDAACARNGEAFKREYVGRYLESSDDLQVLEIA